MTLRLRLAAMMVLILVAALALQYLLIERDRREMLSRLEELSTNMDQTTALFVDRVRSAASRPGHDEIALLLDDLSSSSSFHTLSSDSSESRYFTKPSTRLRNGVTLKVMAWADTTRSVEFLEDESVELRMALRHFDADSMAAKITTDDFKNHEVRVWQTSSELFRHEIPESDSVVVMSEFDGTRMVVKTIAESDGQVTSDTLRGEDAEVFFAEDLQGLLNQDGSRNQLNLTASVLDSVREWNTEMVINLPVGGGPADSFYALQVRYPLDSLTEELESSRRSGLLWLGALLGVGIVGAILVAGQFTRPIRALQSSFGRVESGDLDVRLDPERKDEVGQLTLSFNEMVERLRNSREVEARLTESERMASIGRLAAGVAHEVRNPLHTILLSMQQMRDKLKAQNSEEDPDFERYYGIVTGEIARLESMVSAFLDLSKSEELRFVPVDVIEQLRYAVELFRPEAESKQVRLDLVLKKDAVSIEADPGRLPMVWSNLLSNALAAAPEGSTIRLELQQETSDIVVTCEDEGVGIPDEMGERIWDPFVSGREMGTGLGLSIVRSVVEQHGGSVRLLPPGENFSGARFDVTLPFRQEDA